MKHLWMYQEAHPTLFRVGVSFLCLWSGVARREYPQDSAMDLLLA
jgi:hypothetical protein